MDRDHLRFRERARRASGHVHLTIKTTIAAGGLAETTPGIEAAAVWLPPGREIGSLAVFRSGFDMIRFWMSLPGRDRRRMTAVLRQLAARKKAVMPDPTWHLVAIGVDPAHQGEGLGSALVRSGLHKADLTGSPVYLETETEENVAFYERFGFEVIEQIVVEKVGVPMWLMRRPPVVA